MRDEYKYCIDDEEFDALFFEKVCSKCHLLVTVESDETQPAEQSCPVGFDFSHDPKCPYHDVWDRAFNGALGIIREELEGAICDE